MMTYIIVYIFIMYVVGMFFTAAQLSIEGEITIVDFIMFVLAPISMVTVLIVQIVAFFIDVDMIMFQKEKED